MHLPSLPLTFPHPENIPFVPLNSRSCSVLMSPHVTSWAYNLAKGLLRGWTFEYRLGG